MTDATTEFFDGLRQRGHEPLLHNTKGTLRIELADGKRVERWFVTLDKGEIAVSRKNAAADCTIRTDRALFDGIVRGEVNSMAAVLRGATVVEGDPNLLVRFQRLLPGPPRRRRRRRAAPPTGRKSR